MFKFSNRKISLIVGLVVVSSLLIVFQNFIAIKTVSNRSMYIGYYGLNGWGASQTNEVIEYTNLIWIREFDDNLSFSAVSAEQSIKIMREMKSKYPSAKAIIDISPVFFDPKNFALYGNYKSRWNSYVQNLAKENFNNQYGAFYILDEAYANGLGKGIPAHIMKSQLETVIATVKASFPQIPTAFSYTTNTLNFDLYPLPSGVDWVGVDCYGNWSKCGGANGRSMSEYFKYIESKLLPNQYVLLFPESSLLPLYPEFGANDVNTLIKRMKNYFSWAQTHPKVIAVVPFLFQDAPVERIVGAKNIGPIMYYGKSTTVPDQISVFSKSLMSNVPILPDSFGPQSVPVEALTVISYGRGCSDNNCVWIVVRGLESDFRIDARKVQGGSSAVDWYFRQNQNDMSVTVNKDGNYVVSFRISDPTAKQLLNSTGLNFWVVNPSSSRWTNQIFVK